MIVAHIASAMLISVGLFFFVAGTLGLLRFTDVHSRLHALTKADNLGLGFVILGAAVQADSPWAVLKLVFVWLLTVIAAATVAQLIAQSARPQEAKP